MYQLPTPAQRLAIESHADADFVYTLSNSHTVCRPSCPVRRTSSAKAIVFNSIEEAMAQGYVPCRRCHPELRGWPGARAELAQTARRYIEDHYTEKFSLQQMADDLHTDSSYLARTYHTYWGTTLLQEHNAMRCRAAGKLLTQPSGPDITEISYMVGFPTPSLFSRVFRRVYGCAPSEYRRMCG